MGKYLVMELVPVSDKERITEPDDPAVAIVNLNKLRRAWYANMGLFKNLVEDDAVVAIHFNFPDLVVTSIETTPEEWLDELDGAVRFFEIDDLPPDFEEVGGARTMVVTDAGILFEVLFVDASSVYHTPILKTKNISWE